MKTLLIVDDEELLLEALAFAFEEEGLKTHTAKSVEDALKILNIFEIDAILSDFKMPKRNGIELLKEIQTQRKSIPFTFMSGFAEITDAEAKSLGAKGLIPKPLDLKNISQLITNIGF